MSDASAIENKKTSMADSDKEPGGDNTERPPGDWQVPPAPIQEPDTDPEANEPLKAPTDDPTEEAGRIQV